MIYVPNSEIQATHIIVRTSLQIYLWRWRANHNENKTDSMYCGVNGARLYNDIDYADWSTAHSVRIYKYVLTRMLISNISKGLTCSPERSGENALRSQTILCPVVVHGSSTTKAGVNCFDCRDQRDCFALIVSTIWNLVKSLCCYQCFHIVDRASIWLGNYQTQWGRVEAPTSKLSSQYRSLCLILTRSMFECLGTAKSLNICIRRSPNKRTEDQRWSGIISTVS